MTHLRPTKHLQQQRRHWQSPRGLRRRLSLQESRSWRARSCLQATPRRLGTLLRPEKARRRQQAYRPCAPALGAAPKRVQGEQTLRVHKKKGSAASPQPAAVRWETGARGLTKPLGAQPGARRAPQGPTEPDSAERKTRRHPTEGAPPERQRPPKRATPGGTLSCREGSPAGAPARRRR